MLFDLRGRGRQRTVRSIYLFLAVLMGGGLVLFGIGGNVSGGLLDALKDNQSSSANGFEKRIKAAEKTVVARPSDAKARAALLKLRLEELSGPKFSDPNTGQLTGDGSKRLGTIEAEWTKYLSLKPKPIDTDVAKRLAFTYEAQGGFDKATDVRNAYIETLKKPTAQDYANLAVDAYRAGRTNVGDLAAQRAVDLTKDPARKKKLKKALAAEKAQAGAQSTGATTGSSSG